jgi:hypothetical protein
VKQGAAECGGGANNRALWQKVDEQSGSYCHGHGLNGFASGEVF